MMCQTIGYCIGKKWSSRGCALEISENKIEKIVCSSALNKLKRKVPYGWDLNIFRGCQNGCKYCYAMYSHDYLGEDDFSKQNYPDKYVNLKE